MTAGNGRAVGIIGVGALGLAIAERLIAAGYQVRGYRRSSMDAFAAAGGIAMPSAAATAASGDPLILLLPSDAALHEVIAAIAGQLRPGQPVLCLGTHRIPAKQAAAAIAERAGAVFVEGEISGTPGMMRAGAASAMLAGDEGAVEALRPMLAAFAKAAPYVGAFGNASRMKLITNFLVGVHTVAAAEALILGRRLGLDPRLIVESIAPSAGGSTMLAVRGKMMAEQSYPPGGDIPGFLRFFDLLRDALTEARQDSGPLLDLVEDLYRRAVALGQGNRDIATIYESFERLPA